MGDFPGRCVLTNAWPFSEEEEPITWMMWVALLFGLSRDKSVTNQDEMSPVAIIPYRRVGISEAIVATEGARPVREEMSRP